MEKRLKALFDYQRFEKNSRLADIVEQTESRYKVELSDEELAQVTGGVILPGVLYPEQMKLLINEIPNGDHQ